MTGRLEGKIAVITGGASGIGAATAELFVREGAKVLISDIQDDMGKSLAARLGDAASYRRADVSKEEDVKSLIGHAVDQHGRLDVLFNNAGQVLSTAIGGFEGTEMKDFDAIVSVHLRGVFLGHKYASPVMKAQKSGSIISTASIAGLLGNIGPHDYSVCKAAIIHMAKSAALELAPYKVRSNVVCPGAILTPIVIGKMVSPNLLPQFGEFMKPRFERMQPIPIAGDPMDIAEGVLYFASDASRWVTGQWIAIDGGFTAGPVGGMSAHVDFYGAIDEFHAGLPADLRPKS